MTQPRSTLISLEATSYCHCIFRCVQRAWLCGQDKESGCSFDHRKSWLVDRLKFLSEVFPINIAAYAVMSNYCHLVLHVDLARADTWSNDEVVGRWIGLYRGPELAQRYQQDEGLSDEELQHMERLIKLWRSRLYSISWFMSRLNYPSH